MTIIAIRYTNSINVGHIYLGLRLAYLLKIHEYCCTWSKTQSFKSKNKNFWTLCICASFI